VTIQRNGNVIAIRHKECTNSAYTKNYTCYFDYSASDPTGSQTFQLLDEWSVYYTQGPFCEPFGPRLPQCTVTKKSYTDFGPKFTS
jgi:hypothetical protein